LPLPSGPLRILTVISSLGPGGTERAAENYTLGYAAAGVPVAVLAIAGGSRAETLIRAGVPVFLAGVTPEGRQAALDAALQWNPNIVHVHRHCETPEITALLQRLQSPERRILETNVFARFDASPTGRLIDISLQLSEWCLWKWRHWSRGSGTDTVGVVLPYSVDCRAFFPSTAAERRQMRDELGIPADAFVFGRVGQPSDAKWSPATVQSFAEVALRFPHAYLLLAEAPPSFEELIAALPDDVRRRIVRASFLRGDDNLRRFYGAMNVFLHTAIIGESFGYVLCEAMLCGLPVVTLSRPSHDNSQLGVVGHMRGGLIASQRQHLAEAMTQLIEQPELRRRLSAAAPEWVRTRFDVPLVAQQLMRIAEIALESGTRAEIAARLRAQGFTTEFADRTLHALLRDAIGKPSPLELLVMKVEHVPWIYRAYTRFKALRARIRT
jgi:glycosyltransferase involved in cell wall biosynthesis